MMAFLILFLPFFCSAQTEMAEWPPTPHKYVQLPFYGNTQAGKMEDVATLQVKDTLCFRIEETVSVNGIWSDHQDCPIVLKVTATKQWYEDCNKCVYEPDWSVPDRHKYIVYLRSK